MKIALIVIGVFYLIAYSIGIFLMITTDRHGLPRKKKKDRHNLSYYDKQYYLGNPEISDSEYVRLSNEE
jgi:hypothetical protein